MSTRFVILVWALMATVGLSLQPNACCKKQTAISSSCCAAMQIDTASKTGGCCAGENAKVSIATVCHCYDLPLAVSPQLLEPEQSRPEALCIMAAFDVRVPESCEKAVVALFEKRQRLKPEEPAIYYRYGGMLI